MPAKRLSLRFLGFTIGIVGVMLIAAALYSSQVAANSDAANTLKISPLRTDIEIEPGESGVVPVTVSNLTDNPITVRPVANDFIADGEEGKPALILDDDSYAPSRSLKRFMAPMEDLALPADESKTMNVVINVPEGAQAGGYFGAVRFAPATPDDGGQVNLSPSVASLILLTVPGEVDEKLTVTNFSVQKDGQAGKFFLDSDNLTTLVRFSSDSGVQLGPIGKISVQKGDRVVHEADFNNKNPRDVILPDSARRWEMPLEGIGGFGKYTVSATFTYGQKNQTIDVEQSFWVVPVSIIIAASAGLVVLLGLLIAAGLFVKKRQRRSSKARAGSGLRL